MEHPPLFSAAASGRADEVERLLKGGAAADEKNAAGLTPLMTAARAGHLEVMRLLIAAGANINLFNDEYETCALFQAMAWRNVEAVKVLTDAGADVNLFGKNGFTALMHAAYKADRSLIKHLVSAGADIRAKNSDGQTALDIFKSASPSAPAEILSLLGQ